MNFKGVIVGPKTIMVHIVQNMEHFETFDALFKGVTKSYNFHKTSNKDEQKNVNKANI